VLFCPVSKSLRLGKIEPEVFPLFIFFVPYFVRWRIGAVILSPQTEHSSQWYVPSKNFSVCAVLLFFIYSLQ